jgi:hypothetical protein
MRIQRARHSGRPLAGTPKGSRSPFQSFKPFNRVAPFKTFKKPRVPIVPDVPAVPIVPIVQACAGSRVQEFKAGDGRGSRR